MRKEVKDSLRKFVECKYNWAKNKIAEFLNEDLYGINTRQIECYTKYIDNLRTLGRRVAEGNVESADVEFLGPVSVYDLCEMQLGDKDTTLEVWSMLPHKEKELADFDNIYEAYNK